MSTLTTGLIAVTGSRIQLTKAAMSLRNTKAAYCTGAGIAALVLVLGGPAWGEATLAGDRDELKIVTKDASVEEVLTALSSNFGVHYRSSASLDRRLTGNYAGSLERVLFRVLDGYNFIVSTTSGNVEVIILDRATSGVSAIRPAQRRAD